MNLITDLTDAATEIVLGQLGNKLLTQRWLASVVGIWKERERGFGH